jgi:hypothetical protein
VSAIEAHVGTSSCAMVPSGCWVCHPHQLRIRGIAIARAEP